MPTANILAVQNLTIHYGDFVAVKNLSLEIFRGEIFCLLGPNGSGKSSTLSAVSGILQNVSGQILVEGICCKKQPDEYRHRIGVVPQQLALYEELTPIDNLRFFGGFYKLGKKELKRRIDKVLELVGLNQHKHQPVRTLSGGMQRRVNLACALLHNPPLILLDEPATGLDLAARDTMQSVLQQLRSENHTILIATHLISEAEQWCNRFGIMYKGQLIAAGTLDEMVTRNKKMSEHDKTSRVDKAHQSQGCHTEWLNRYKPSPGSPEFTHQTKPLDADISIPENSQTLKQIYAALVNR